MSAKRRILVDELGLSIDEISSITVAVDTFIDLNKPEEEVPVEEEVVEEAPAEEDVPVEEEVVEEAPAEEDVPVEEKDNN